MAEFKLRLEKYQANSLVFIEGNRNNDNFYIIKSGRISTSRIHEIEDEADNVLQTGDSFGVVSCLAMRPRIDTAKTLTPVELISVQRDQFIPLMQNNSPIAIKILRTFSKKLRDFDAAITRMALKKPVSENAQKIAEIGDYYFSKKKFKQAYYCYTRFLLLNPENTNEKIMRNKKIIESYKIDISEFQQMDSFTRFYKDKSMLFCEYETGNEVFIIQKGRVQVSKIISDKELLLAVLNPGDVIGEMAILENKPRNASAIAFGDVTALVLNKTNFLNMVQNNPQIVLKTLTLLSERIWVAYRQLENIAIKDDYKRMLDSMMIQLEKQKVEFQRETALNVGLSPDDLIKLIGISEDKEDEMMNRLLSDKNFELVNNSIIIKNPEEFSKQIDSIRKFQLNKEKK